MQELAAILAPQNRIQGRCVSVSTSPAQVREYQHPSGDRGPDTRLILATLQRLASDLSCHIEAVRWEGAGVVC